MIILFLLTILGVHTPAVDNGPCPIDQPAVIAGDDYAHDLWVHADGTVFGWSAEEDECILPIGATR